MKFYLEPKHLWIGLYWTTHPYRIMMPKGKVSRVLKIYICLVPCVVLETEWELK